VEARELGEYFELLLATYELDEQEGRPLTELMQEEWALFRSSDMDQAKSQVLLGEILDDGNIVRRLHRPADSLTPSQLGDWDRFSEELKHKNRFFPDVDFGRERLEDLLSRLLEDSAAFASTWYRARICSDDGAFTTSEMGAPPARKARHGRANPAGIPYLYLASDERTALAEVRPHPGERVSIAEFSVDALTIVDLRHPIVTVSPFLSRDEEEIKLLRGDIQFLERLGQELTIPVVPNSAAIDYIPSQFLCEFIKKAGYDGLAYRSSVGAGVNLAIFQTDRGTPVAVRHAVVTKLEIQTADVNDGSIPGSSHKVAQ